MYTPPGAPRSRSFTRFTMRVGLLHFGQSVLLVVSIIFLRSAVLAILAILFCSSSATNVFGRILRHAYFWRAKTQRAQALAARTLLSRVKVEQWDQAEGDVPLRQVYTTCGASPQLLDEGAEPDVPGCAGGALG